MKAALLLVPEEGWEGGKVGFCVWLGVLVFFVSRVGVGVHRGGHPHLGSHEGCQDQCHGGVP